jgi:uncharacterized protein (DUF433 family)
MNDQCGTMNAEGALIEADPRVMLGKPVVRGTRITVELIVEKLAAGETVEQLLAAHPHLTEAGAERLITRTFLRTIHTSETESAATWSLT